MRRSRGMQIIAHRGASHDAPENTVAAARLAWTQGADALEVDVHLTRDGRLAVIHDADARRIAGTAHVVANATLAELQQLDAGRWKSPAFAGERIPSLDDILAAVPPGKRLFVELKSGPESVSELARCFSASGLQPEQVAIIAFAFDVAIAAKHALPQCEVCWLADSGRRAPLPTVPEIAGQARAAGLDGIDLHRGWLLERATVERIHQQRLKIYVWTVDDPIQARRLREAGIDGLATNRPGWMRAQLGAG